MTNTTPESQSGNEPSRLHIDTDWKAQAQAEKERLSQKEKEREKERPRSGGPDDLPPSDFKSLVGVLASQALMSLGGYADPATGRAVVDLGGAKFVIDLMEVLEQKTKGNLSSEEAEELKSVIGQLQSRFVQITGMVARQMAAKAGSESAGAGPLGGADPGAASGAGPRIVQP
ncbi:MAG: DUF1844 domain-containing protein [Phycisphaerales bacterium]|nr:DUF1844 domain-containing protein [Phycisphaerales bacterium]